MTKILKEFFVWKFFNKNFPLPRHLFRLNVIIVKWCQQVMLTLFLSSSDIFTTISEVSTKVSSFSVKRFITLLITIHSFFYSYANFSVKRFHLRNNQNDSKKNLKRVFIALRHTFINAIYVNPLKQKMKEFFHIIFYCQLIDCKILPYDSTLSLALACHNRRWKDIQRRRKSVDNDGNDRNRTPKMKLDMFSAAKSRNKNI